MSCGTGLRQVDRLGSRFDQLKLDTTLEFLQLISSKIEGQGATGMPDVEEFFGHRGLGDAIRRDVNRGTKVIKSALELLGQASRDEERVHACVERTIPAVEELLRPVVVGRVPISAPQFFREFDVWQQLLAVALPERSLVLWRDWIKDIIGRRLRAYEDRSLLELFCHDRTHGLMVGAMLFHKCWPARFCMYSRACSSKFSSIAQTIRHRSSIFYI